MVSPGRDTPEQCRFLPATRTGLKLESVEGAAIAAGDKKKNVKGCYEDNQVVVHAVAGKITTVKARCQANARSSDVLLSVHVADCVVVSCPTMALVDALVSSEGFQR
ncbi:hypothetical protein PF010_g5383 [Phytophthora fragariae]|nr:hypothetical protein PF010_g5383 [Phytophthora fragariae]KAE9249512.1 hypothetical protein PF002_g5256 [Phytophthora fragariae]